MAASLVVPASASSALFTPYRTIGQVCDGAQGSVYALGATPFFATSIGNAFAVYKCDHLALALVSKPLATPITHVVTSKERTFTATDGGIVVWARTKPVRLLRWAASAGASDSDNDVVALLPLGPVLLSLHTGGGSSGGGCLRVWDIAAATAPAAARDGGGDALVSTVHLPARHVPTALLHPDTYLNKVAVGTAGGSVLIVNFRSGKVVYDAVVAAGTAVCALAQSTVVDVVAVGTADGRVLIHNLKADAPVASFSHASADKPAAAGRVTAAAFSGGATIALPLLATATESGAVALWNLADRTLQALLPAAHGGAVTTLAWMPGQPVLLTAGSDNAIHMWVVDKLDGSPRLLRSRTGHTAPPRIVRYYGGAAVASLASGADAAACEVASAGGDRALRMFHTALDRQNVELSQGSLVARARELGVHPNALRLPAITALAASDRRKAQWADVVTTHAGDSRAYLWSWDTKRLLDRVLALPDATEAATAVAISACGHFAVVGGMAGTVVKFNLQSGVRRGAYPRTAVPYERPAARGARRPDTHESVLPPPQREGRRGDRDGASRLRRPDSVDASLFAVMGIRPRGAAGGAGAGAARAVVAAPLEGGAGGDGDGGDGGDDDAVVRHTAPIVGVGVDGMNSVLVSVDASGLVALWDFDSHALKAAVRLPAPACALALQRDSNLAAVACDDFSVRVLDVATRKLARTFVGHANRVTDVAFSPDGRWLATASLDRTLRVWDLPTGRCVDWLAFERAVTSLAFAPTSEYLVTSHVDTLGLCLWANKAHFSSVVLDVAPAAPVLMGAPATMAEAAGDGDGGAGGAAGAGDAFAATAAGDDDDDDEDAGAGAGAAAKRRRAGTATDAGATTAAAAAAVAAAAAAATPAAGGAPATTPLPGCHLTLSGVPATAWMNLTRLDVIAARNKPTEPPKKPQSAPFFLPTVASLTPSFVAPGAAPAPAPAPAPGGGAGEWSSAWVDDDGGSDGGGDGDDAAAAPSASRVLGRPSGAKAGSGRVARSVLAGLLRGVAGAPVGRADGAVDGVARHLAALAPAAVDMEVRSLCVGAADADGVALVGALLRYFEVAAARGDAFDLVQAQLTLTLQIYQDVILATPALVAAAGRLRAALRPDYAALRTALDRGLCMVSLFLGQ